MRNIIFVIGGFAVGFVAGAIVNEMQQKKKMAVVTPKETAEKKEEKVEEKPRKKEDIEKKVEKIFDSKEAPSDDVLLKRTEVKTSFTDYAHKPDVEDFENVPRYIMSDKAAYADNLALGVASSYEPMELYFNINDGTCTDDSAEPVEDWEDLLGPDCCDALRRQIGRNYEGIPMHEREFYVINNDCECFFQVRLIVE